MSPGRLEKRKPEYIKAMEVRRDAGKGDVMRPTSAAFAENFDEAFAGSAEAEAPEEFGPLGAFAREKITVAGITGPRYLLDPGALLDEIDRKEKA